MLRKKAPKPCKNNKGQASVMIGMMTLTFVLFFMFVINTGMLVNAKINLQNAADLAAYAGASVQARQLNQISFLNYEMRRQYKKFLFRYNVLGNMAQKTFDDTSGQRIWAPRGPAHGGTLEYGVPTTCVIFQTEDNYCHMETLPRITIPAKNPLDQVNETLRGQLQAIEAVRRKSCEGIGKTNLQLTLLWLWNTDPELTTYGNSYSSGENRNVLERIKGMALGLGLMPRLAILNRRIKTLQSYVNYEAQVVTRDTISALQKSQDPVRRERPIQAFLSAYNTLGNNTFQDDIVMEELLPAGNEGAGLLGLNYLSIPQFTIYALDFSVKPGEANDDGKDCEPWVRAFPVKNVPIGVSKNTSILTYYALKLQASAKVMFSPFGDMKLKAYSAAQPFGSRIGPHDGFRIDNAKITQAAFTYEGEPIPKSDCNTPDSDVAMPDCDFVPNLAVKADDSAGKGSGWDNQGFMRTTFEKALNTSGGLAVDAAALQKAYPVAMSPNPSELGQYNIPSDAPDHFVEYFDDSGFYAFWAPIAPPEATANMKDEITKIAQDLAPPETRGGSDPAGAEFLKAIEEGFTKYFKLLSEGKGEDGEGMNIVRLANPFNMKPGGGKPAQSTLIGGDYSINATQAKTSWNAVKDETLRPAGRIGYSVKFVSFNTLLKQQGVSSSAKGGNWTNSLNTSSDTQADLELIQH